MISLGLTGQLTLAITMRQSYFLSLWERIEVRATWSPALTPTLSQRARVKSRELLDPNLPVRIQLEIASANYSRKFQTLRVSQQS